MRIYRGSTLGLYNYVVNNPVIFVDPDGNIDIKPAPDNISEGMKDSTISVVRNAGQMAGYKLGQFTNVPGTLSLGKVTAPATNPDYTRASEEAGNPLISSDLMSMEGGETSMVGVVLTIPLGQSDKSTQKPSLTSILGNSDAHDDQGGSWDNWLNQKEPCLICMQNDASQDTGVDTSDIFGLGSVLDAIGLPPLPEASD